MKSKLQAKTALFTVNIFYAVTAGICMFEFVHGLIRLMLETIAISDYRYSISDEYEIETKALFWGALLLLIISVIAYSFIRKYLINYLEKDTLTEKVSNDQLDSESEKNQQVNSYTIDTVAGTYTWTCPKCGKVNKSTSDVDTCSCGYSPME